MARMRRRWASGGVLEAGIARRSGTWVLKIAMEWPGQRETNRVGCSCGIERLETYEPGMCCFVRGTHKLGTLEPAAVSDEPDLAVPSRFNIEEPYYCHRCLLDDLRRKYSFSRGERAGRLCQEGQRH